MFRSPILLLAPFGRCCGAAGGRFQFQGLLPLASSAGSCHVYEKQGPPDEEERLPDTPRSDALCAMTNPTPELTLEGATGIGGGEGSSSSSPASGSRISGCRIADCGESVSASSGGVSGVSRLFPLPAEDSAAVYRIID